MHRADTKRGIGTSEEEEEARRRPRPSRTPWASHAANVALFAIGVFFLTGGLYATAETVRDKFREGVGAPFSCASNALA
jgi:hypothetical protein